MARIFQTDDGQSIWLADAQVVPKRNFVGRDVELRLCRAAFGLSDSYHLDSSFQPLHFRLEGAPGVGKNELVYEIARRLAEMENIPFYSIQGHEEMTPEDLSLLVVPDPDNRRSLSLQLRASPLATALYEGGLFFFDEINRVPARALSPLASVLDDRRALYSATTGITMKSKDEQAHQRFRFCCALNPGLGKAGQGVLPDYIEERTLPAIQVEHLDQGELRAIIAQHIGSDEKLLEGFTQWYEKRAKREVSARQVIALAKWVAMTIEPGQSPDVDAFQKAERNIMRPEQRL